MTSYKPVTFNSTLNVLEYTGKVTSIEKQRVLLADFPSYFELHSENQSIQETLSLAQRSNKHVTISVNPMNNAILNAALTEPTSPTPTTKKQALPSFSEDSEPSPHKNQPK